MAVEMHRCSVLVLQIVSHEMDPQNSRIDIYQENSEAGERAQLLKSLATLTENLSSDPSTHRVAHNHT